jgi:hypothetical protein
LTREEKQTELEKHRAIVSATLDYLLDHFTGTIVYDDFDLIKDYYEQQKIQTGKYFRQRRLDRLGAQLRRLTEGFKHEVNQKFEQYIRERTGYEIDVLAEERNQVEEVLAKQTIDTEKEAIAVSLCLRTNRLVSQEEENSLKLLLEDYYESRRELDKHRPKQEKVNSEIIKTVEEDGMITETIKISFGPKPLHFFEREAISPDGKRRVTVTEWSDGKNSSTSVIIFFDKASGPIYGASGLYSDVNASWKDNNTIVIETKKSYFNGLQHRKVQSFDDIIFVEYIET